MTEGITDQDLAARLNSALNLQLTGYRELRNLSEQMLGQLVLSRGDIAGMGKALERTRELTADIAGRIDQVKALSALWEERRDKIGMAEEVEKLNAVIDQIDTVVKGFLSAESQIKRHLEHAMGGDRQNPNHDE